MNILEYLKKIYTEMQHPLAQNNIAQLNLAACVGERTKLIIDHIEQIEAERDLYYRELMELDPSWVRPK